jgi:hypothetical protein
MLNSICRFRISAVVVACLLQFALPATAGPPRAGDAAHAKADNSAGLLKEGLTRADIFRPEFPAQLANTVAALESGKGAESGHDLEARLGGACDFVMDLVMSNGSLPRWGPDTTLQDLRLVLFRAGKLLRREDLRDFGAPVRPDHGPAMPKTVAGSKVFPDVGAAVLRTGFASRNVYLAVRSGTGIPGAAPDSNSLVLTAYGQELIAEPGCLSVTPPEQLAALQHSSSRTLVTMDGLDSAPGGKATLQTGVVMDLVDAQNAGYSGPNVDPTARHRRRVLLAKPNIFLVIDDVSADAPHSWTQRFHFSPGEVLYSPTGSMLEFSPAVAAFTQLPSQSPNASDVARPPAGLLLFALNQNRPKLEPMPLRLTSTTAFRTPAASWTLSDCKSGRFVTLLLPHDEDQLPGQWAVARDSNANIVAYGPLDDQSETIFVVKAEPGAAPVKTSFIPDALSDADVALFRYARSTKRSEESAGAAQMAIVHGRSLIYKNVPMFASEQPQDDLQVTWNGDSVVVRGTGSGRVRLATLQAKWLVVNDRPKVPIAKGAQVTEFTL